ncbi:MAG: BrnT family toxin [Methylobacteriaceae bacterium]|nr:BrnT family toxin [Methylobacteriaceae bacterium]
MQYEWDNSKAAANLHKHGVDFADAIAGLEDANRVEEIDTRFPYEEEKDPGHRNGSRQGILRGCHAPGRGYMQDHIGSKGHTNEQNRYYSSNPASW